MQIPPPRPHFTAICMNRITGFAQRLFQSFFGFVATTRRSPAGSLLDSASARSGLNPHQAQELRRAARADLSVVR